MEYELDTASLKDRREASSKERDRATDTGIDKRQRQIMIQTQRGRDGTPDRGAASVVRGTLAGSQ